MWNEQSCTFAIVKRYAGRNSLSGVQETAENRKPVDRSGRAPRSAMQPALTLMSCRPVSLAVLQADDAKAWRVCTGYVLRGERYRTPEEEAMAQEQGDTPVDYFGKALLASGEPAVAWRLQQVEQRARSAAKQRNSETPLLCAIRFALPVLSVPESCCSCYAHF